MHLRNRRRLIVSEVDSVYHVISRTSCRQYLFEDREKEAFRKLLWKQVRFSGLELLSYCIMSNHFHIVVRVPQKEQIDDGELLKRYREYYNRESLSPYTLKPSELEELLKAGGDEAEQIRKKVMERMGDLSAFMRELKQNFSIWYNRIHHNEGTIWSSRFKSILVENTPVALRVLCAYINLNPVRAQIVNDPADYRFCSYAEALGGSHRAQQALMQVTGVWNWAQCIEIYRLCLYSKGAGQKGTIGKDEGVLDSDLVEMGVSLKLSDELRYRWRYFSDGLILGSESYLDEIFQRHRKWFSPKRKSAARKMEGEHWGSLRVFRAVAN